MWVQIISLPLIGALIGWVTNVLAIKLIFRPYKPIVIPVINYRIQGLIPKRRDELALNVGQVIGNELLSIDDLFNRINENDVKEKIIHSVKETIYCRLDERIPILIPVTIRKVFLSLIADILQKETPVMINRLLFDLSQKIKDEIDFSEIVRVKINSYDLHELERVILLIASRELKHIEILGGVLGFSIGLVQAAWLYFLK
ncbi:MAG: DUF445 domain-containing protein [Bacillota bacterium]|jgi:uncharacterized membrane protein YheB (UPF0754 family)